MTREAPSIAALVLAAGGSKRLGRPKQFVELNGKTLLRNALESALDSHCRDVFVVTGAHQPRIQCELKGFAVKLVHNPDWQDGLGSSIGAGVKAIANDSYYQGVLVIMCDQPCLNSPLLDRMIDSFENNPEAIVVCEYAETLGVPALFGKAHFDRLQGLRGDQGARDWLRSGIDPKVRIPFPEGAWDIDRESDLQRVITLFQ